MKTLDILRDYVSKAENNKTRLESKSSKYKLELLNYENSNKENEKRLAILTKKNQIIKKDIEILKEKLSANLTEEIVTYDDLKHKLHCLSNDLYNKIINLKNKSNIYDNANTNIKHDSNENLNNDPIDKNYKSKEIEKDDTEKLLKIQNLIHEVENKNLEIENLRNRVNDLSEENDSLCKQLMFHKGNYEDKLTILKKKYDSSISALHKKHEENIEHLKMNFEEINGEKIIFDSESWLQSLSIKELRNVHNRIYSLMNKLDINNDNINQNTIINVNNKEDLRETLDKLTNICENDKKEDASTEIQHKQTKLQEDKLRILKNHNLKLKNHDSSKTLMNLQKHSLHNKDENKVKNFFRNIDWEEMIFFDPTSHTNKYKNTLNSRLNNNEKKYANRNVTSISATRTTTKSTIDWQRNNFIYQCSVHHKKSNIC
ncbi:putative leucine-rich repeat-containing protein DDB_G0290503 [Polistes fuscatus]|uniref:putative leucine-rich repeat-containing protein DDB_G0290503 n=1 Tax=Polistes fuscatus TaxID=30207 RepID=UPI001CA92E91|nr:putative leucine-rich repeat-containing protein DDB_G0290503 [Polistes fuscatus]